VIFEGSESQLAETQNSQLAIYVMSLAILRVMQSLHPTLLPSVVAGLSLGEYTALTASGKLSFKDGIQLVNHRAGFMNDVCEKTVGTMAVVLGLNAEDVEQIVALVNLPNDLWVANYNCPGQVVISGTNKGIEAGSAKLKLKGAKRVLPLRVHGAFHSALMAPAEKNLKPYIEAALLQETPVRLFMNVPGSLVTDSAQIKQYLIAQVTHSVKWEQTIRQIKHSGVQSFVEIGCGKTLAGFNKRIDDTIETISIEKVTDLDALEIFL
jgi:[acyl-carrier-protein] S-malonyltransferase